ncbi:hypothetical protein BH24CHL4_BH24CHL4_01240 [soil metagenome]
MGVAAVACPRRRPQSKSDVSDPNVVSRTVGSGLRASVGHKRLPVRCEAGECSNLSAARELTWNRLAGRRIWLD